MKSDALYAFIGKKIRKRREDQRITQKMLASHCGVDRSLISCMESGKYRIPVDRLCQIARILQVRPQFFLPKKYAKNVTLRDDDKSILSDILPTTEG